MSDELAAMANAGGGTLLVGVDDKTREITGIPQRSQNRLIGFDEQIVASAQVSDMNKELWARFRTALSPSDDREFLAKLRLADYDENGDMHPTISGVLMCCDKPEKIIPSAFIQAVCYLGDCGNSEQPDVQDITGWPARP